MIIRTIDVSIRGLFSFVNKNIDKKILTGGLLLAGKLVIKAGLHRIHSAMVKNAAVVIISLYGLMTEGKTDFESM
jgi:hypothetical protein